MLATALVRPGENLIAAQATHARVNTPAGLIGAVKLEFESGEPLLIQSGNSWRAIANVEGGWEKPGYLDSAWQAAAELGEYGIAPWKEAGFMRPPSSSQCSGVETGAPLRARTE